MNKNNNWVKISRYIFDWEWYEDKNVFKLFLHLILECNYTDKQWKGINISRGQLISGRKKLSVKTGLSEQEIRTAEKKLLSTNDITKERINNYSLYTVVNYNKWQSKTDGNNTIATNESTNESTNNQPQLKKVKKEKTYINTSTTTETLNGNLFLIDRLCKEYNITEEHIKEMIDKFCIWLVETEKEIHSSNHDLFTHFESWLKKRDISQYKLDVEVKWFVERFNEISKRGFKVTPTIKKLFAKQFDIGYSGEEMRIAIASLYSSDVGNKFHIDSSFKFATPQYLLKDDNVNKYLNVRWSKKRDWKNANVKRERLN